MPGNFAHFTPALPLWGAGTLAIPMYYRKTTQSTVRVIRSYRNRGAIAMGRSPWSAIMIQMISTAPKILYARGNDTVPRDRCGLKKILLSYTQLQGLEYGAGVLQ